MVLPSGERFKLSPARGHRLPLGLWGYPREGDILEHYMP